MLAVLNAVVIALAAVLILLDVIVFGVILATCAIALLLLSLMLVSG